MMTPTTDTVHLAVYDGFADWEAGLAVAQIRSGAFQPGPAHFDVRTVGPSREPVRSMGGVLVTPDLALDELAPSDSAMLIVPGGGGWEAEDGNGAFPRKARTFLDASVPVAAICGATFGLAREGLLDDRDHTGADAGYLVSSGYRGADRYRDADAVRDRGLITAGPTDAVAFAREILAELGLMGPEVLAAWFRLFGRSDASAYGDLLRLTGAAA